MITSLKIHNFRCFRDLTIEPLARVNLLVGANNAGKTSVLEALFLHSAPNIAALPIHILAFRGISRPAAKPDELWRWLWPWADTAQPSTIACTYSDGCVFTHEMLETPGGQVEDLASALASQRLSSSASGQERSVARTLRRSYAEPRAEEASSSISLGNGEPKLEGQPDRPRYVSTFVLVGHRNGPDDSSLFSDLARDRKQGSIVSALRVFEPSLQGLELLMLGDQPAIHADLGTEKLIPLAYLGDGAVRLTSILLAFVLSRGGVLLIDEVDSGLHYSVQEKVWQAIWAAAQEFDVQVFATTHSIECIHAAQRAFAATDPSALLVHRIERQGDATRVVTIDCETLGGTAQLGFEVR